MTRLLQDRVSEQAERRPDAIAVTMQGEALSYARLDQDSDRLAQLLRDSGCAPGDRVGMFLPKSPGALVSMFAALKAGVAYVPMDPASPPRRLAAILDACDPKVILVSAATAGALVETRTLCPALTSTRIGWFDAAPPGPNAPAPDFTLEDVARTPVRRLDPRVNASAPAHILFTSGSTGTPKGVVITHANVLAFLDWALRYFGARPGDRHSGHPPLHFDLSTFDVFGTLSAGAELHLVPPELNLLPHKVAEFIRTAALTQWFSVPSALVHMAKYDAVRPNDFPELRRLLWCGEVLPTPSLCYWMQRLPHVTFTNLYGPTETTIASSFYTVPGCPADERAAIPIGTACDGEELLVLDERLEPTPPGESGDLYIRGAGLSPGYWRDPERTRLAFLPAPGGRGPEDRIYRTGDLATRGADGLVYFLGRMDSQIKARGHRIELGEIETALDALDCLRESAVVAIPTDGFEGTLIACAYVLAPGADVTPARLRSALGEVLPRYMLPTRWMALDRLPRTSNGKVSRRELREAFAGYATQVR